MAPSGTGCSRGSASLGHPQRGQAASSILPCPPGKAAPASSLSSLGIGNWGMALPGARRCLRRGVGSGSCGPGSADGIRHRWETRSCQKELGLENVIIGMVNKFTRTLLRQGIAMVTAQKSLGMRKGWIRGGSRGKGPGALRGMRALRCAPRLPRSPGKPCCPVPAGPVARGWQGPSGAGSQPQCRRTFPSSTGAP